MSGLVLKLAPNERVLINGAVIENGDRRTKIAIKTPNVNVLRLRDAIHPDSARTPVSRALYIAQLILSGDADPVEGRRQLLVAIEQLSQVFDDRDSRLLLAEATVAAVEANPYQALRKLRDLLPREARLFASTKE
ncbi:MULTISPECIES: flagellar biosynthesis repressor FlbT [Paracoccus]|uniref:Flagellar biosynthesis repressor FlbT n=1 Tax=Paracoccus hibiscisoli TaxID=2023261 RepID=A0A4U0QZE8_9RHOB|nr:MULTISPECIES: flagellar biosynthesis repressor FlbT [Paracoccus]ODT57778.1 MAG: flagellar biosynthesis repressor FlbT [Paracoccus sp. SCN 68-21]TJZ87783.1 flagellar biosynthesis repressor FlbT [Paracoccus hibiscisoli]